MNDYRLSRRQLIGLAAGLVAGGISVTAPDPSSGATTHMTENDNQSARLYGLQCEYLTDPLAVDEPSPRLSWRVESPQRAWRQTAYQIHVASTIGTLMTGKGDLWDSNKIATPETTHIEYDGVILSGRQQCFWRVRSYDENGLATAWSDPGTWEMGLLVDEDWKSSVWIGRLKEEVSPSGNLDGVSWIWFPEQGGNPAVSATAGQRWFRKTFAVGGGRKIVSAKLYFTADDSYDVRINGKEIAKSKGEGWQSVKQRDVTNSIDLGENVLAIIGINIQDAAGLACRLIVNYDHGAPQIVDSDESWKTSNTDFPGWDTLGFDDSGWPAAEVVAAMGDKPWGTLTPPPEQLADADPAPYLRSEFESNGTVKRARLYACGLGYADIYLNGKRLGDHAERETPYTAFDKRVLYSTYDVTSTLVSGINAVGAVLGKGWYDVHDLAVWGFEHASWRGPQRLRLLLAIEYVDGKTDTVVTGSHWKTSTGPIVRDGIYSGEIYDARLEVPGWNKPSFDDSGWMPAILADTPAGKLRARPCPPIAVTENIDPVDITEPSAGVYVVNFGQNFAGHVQLRVIEAAGTSITLRYGELVHADGSLDTSNVQNLMDHTDPPQLFQTDTYICKGGGVEEIWEQRFGYSGLQYAEVTGLSRKPSKSSFVGRFAHTALESAGSFSCSDLMINKLQEATRWSYLSNAQSIPTDCPQREKNGWTGDAHLAAETGLMNFRSSSFYTKWLSDFADNQKVDGRVGVIVPSGGWGLGDCHPAWDSAYAIVAWDLYRYSGDTRILKSHFDNISHYVDYLSGQLVDDVIPFDSLGDWVPWKTQTPSQLSSTVFLYHDANILSWAAKLLGRENDSRKYDSLATRVKAGFNAKWYDANTKMYSVGEQTAQAMPLFFGLTSRENHDDVFAALVANVERQGHIDCGILGAKYTLRVLSDGGRADLVYHLITRKEQPSWAWWITQGATTLWEQWTEDNSHNHIMFGDISNWFYQSVAGIGLDPDSPGFSNVLIRPQVVGGITWAKGTHVGPHGPIASSWSVEKGVFELNITLPANTSATVWVPTTSSSKVTESGTPVGTAKAVRMVRVESDATVYSVGSGSYSFKVT